MTNITVDSQGLSYEYLYESDKFDHCHQYLLKSILEALADLMETEESKPRILDLGCGNGSLSKAIARAGYEVVGVEESISGIEMASQHNEGCTFVQASIYDLPYNHLEDSFDLVISTEVIEHLLYPKELVIAAKRCLKPKGKLVVSTPYHGYLKNLIIAATGKMDSHFNPLWDGGHVKFFSVSTLRQLFEQEGFGGVKFRYAGRTPLLWKSMLCSGVLEK